MTGDDKATLRNIQRQLESIGMEMEEMDEMPPASKTFEVYNRVIALAEEVKSLLEG